MIVLRNEVGLRHPTGELETRHVGLVAYGQPGGFSAMARTVGYPAAIAARMLLDGQRLPGAPPRSSPPNPNLAFGSLPGEIRTKGLVVPMTREIYGPVLTRLKDEGLYFSSTSTLQD